MQGHAFAKTAATAGYKNDFHFRFLSWSDVYFLFCKMGSKPFRLYCHINSFPTLNTHELYHKKLWPNDVPLIHTAEQLRISVRKFSKAISYIVDNHITTPIR